MIYPPRAVRRGTRGSNPPSRTNSSIKPSTNGNSRSVRPPPRGRTDKPWEQALEPDLVDTSSYAKSGPYHLCFSNASVDNPWRQVGWKTMQAEVELHDEIAEFTVLDAEAKDDKQITDIASLLSRGCDALIVSPNTTATLTPAVEQACDSGIPVIVFDRGVNTDCPVTFIHPIGGYAFGATAAEFLAEKSGGGRCWPCGSSPESTCWRPLVGGRTHLRPTRLEVVGVEFTEATPRVPRASSVTTSSAKAGSTASGWTPARPPWPCWRRSRMQGMEPPAISGEDQQQFLEKWSKENLTAQAPSYPTYQWRTPVIAALRVLSGEQVPHEWILPQPMVTAENLDQYLVEGMPPLHYALCGCQDMPDYPQRWQ